MSSDYLNHDGQPANQAFNARKVRARQQAELSGMLKGVACDGLLTPSEAKYIYEWINVHLSVDDGVTYTGLIEELQATHESTDAKFNDDRALNRILSLINNLVNGGKNIPSAYDLTMDVTAKIDPSSVVFKESLFCFTGKLRFGPRTKAHAETIKRGGRTTSDISPKICYLVCGDLGSRDWSQSSFGEKIREALTLQTKGANLLIISEETWVKALSLCV